MFVPLHYQVSEYDCVPTSLINAVAYLFEREEIPPMVVRHIFAYSLDTVGRQGTMGRSGTSRPAIRLMGHWLDSYRTPRFNVRTEYLEGEAVHLRNRSPIREAVRSGGVALCNIRLSKGEEHFMMAVHEDDDWIYCFDPYFRTRIRGLRGLARILIPEDGRAPNLSVRRDWLDGAEEGSRFVLGPVEQREVLIVQRTA